MESVSPLVGEQLALDLVNTRPRVVGGEVVDLLATPELLAAWLGQEADRLVLELPTGPVSVSGVDVAAVAAVREHAAVAIAAVRRGGRPPDDALRGIDEARAAAPVAVGLTWSDGVVVARRRRDGPLGQRVAARLAEAVGDLLTEPAVGAIRQCAAEGCVMLFLPAHPRRRWCSASRCGNRVRVARYQRRHRAS